MFAAPVGAVTYEVNATQDAVDASPGDGVCETAAGNGICTLRAAIQEANASTSGANLIEVPAGTYQLTLAGSDEDVAASGDLDVLGNVSIVGADPSTTIVDAGLLDRVFDIGSSANVTLSNLTIQHGGNVETGGGIQNSGILALTNCVIQNNGGNNGPVRFGAGIANLKALVLTNSIVRDNQAGATGQAGAAGAGIYNVLGASIDASQISGNVATGMGAIAGGILSQDPAITQIAATAITNNTAPQAGGVALAGGQLIVLSSLVANNSASGSGGAGGGFRVVGGSASLVNVTVSGNAASTGGGLAVTSGTVDLGNVTVSDNRVVNGTGHGGGLQVASGATVSARNSLLAENQDPNASAQPDCSGTLTSNGYVLLQSTVGCLFETSTGDLTGIDPNLGPLSDNGGPTKTQALISSSAAVDAANPAGCTGLNGSPLLTDQRGEPRPSDGNNNGISACDMGAFELQSDIIFANGFEDSD